MADETLFAVVGADGVVENVIVADQEFIDSLSAAIADPEHDTGALTADHKFYDVTGKDPQPGVGWTRAKNGRFSAPTPPEPTQAELDAQAAADQRAADDDFLASIRNKVDAGTELTAAEQTRLTFISASRAPA